MRQQQGDVSLFQTNDDGDIAVVDGIVEMSSGLETSAYLSLFGGNEDDDGRADNPQTWWANLDESDPSRKYISETQNLLRSIPATSGNLMRLEDAAKRDLQWMSPKMDVTVTVPALNRVKFSIIIEENKIEFTENWRASR